MSTQIERVNLLKLQLAGYLDHGWPHAITSQLANLQTFLRSHSSDFAHMQNPDIPDRGIFKVELGPQANIERLKSMSKLLALVHEEERKFDIMNWCTESECGTTACAVGWLIQTKEWTDGGGFHQILTLRHTDGETSELLYNWDAVCQWFGISLPMAFNLFNGASMATNEKHFNNSIGRTKWVLGGFDQLPVHNEYSKAIDVKMHLDDVLRDGHVFISTSITKLYNKINATLTEVNFKFEAAGLPDRFEYI